jgi:hypothetical protein
LYACATGSKRCSVQRMRTNTVRTYVVQHVASSFAASAYTRGWLPRVLPLVLLLLVAYAYAPVARGGKVSLRLPFFIPTYTLLVHLFSYPSVTLLAVGTSTE